MANCRRNLNPWHLPYDPRFVASPAMIKGQRLFVISVTAYLADLVGSIYLAFYLSHQ
jgi:hypothetical protein